MATQFYRAKDPKTGKEVFKETGTDRYIGATEFGGGAGFTEQTATPTPTRTQPQSQLGTYKGNNKLVDIIKEGIKRKQGMNKDLQSSKQYWRTQQRDPMTFTDERLQLLSPAEQQSLREKRYATAGSALKGLGEEEAYRESRLSDTIDSVTRAGEAEMSDQELALKKQQEARLARAAEIDAFESMDGTGYTTDPDGNIVRDYTSATAEQIAMAMKGVESGGNYDAKGGSNETGAYQYTPGTWNSYSQQYAKEVLGRSENIPMTPENQDKVTIFKVQKWLDGGYSPQQIVSMWNAGEGRPNAYAENHRGTNSFGVKYDTPGHVEKVMGSLGKLMGTPTEEAEWVDVTDSDKKKMMDMMGIQEREARATGLVTYDDWKEMKDTLTEESVIEFRSDMNKAFNKKTDAQTAMKQLKANYSDGLLNKETMDALFDEMIEIKNSYGTITYKWRYQ